MCNAEGAALTARSRFFTSFGMTNEAESGIIKKTRLEQRVLLRQQGQALNVPGKMMHAACGGEDDGAARSEGEAHETLASNLEIGQAIGRNLHDSARTGERGGYIEV